MRVKGLEDFLLSLADLNRNAILYEWDMTSRNLSNLLTLTEQRTVVDIRSYNRSVATLMGGMGRHFADGMGGYVQRSS